MSGVLDDFEKVQREYKQVQREFDKLKGAEEQLLQTLKEQCGCKTEEEGVEEMERLKALVLELSELYSASYSKFKKEFGDVFQWNSANSEKS